MLLSIQAIMQISQVMGTQKFGTSPSWLSGDSQPKVFEYFAENSRSWGVVVKHKWLRARHVILSSWLERL